MANRWWGHSRRLPAICQVRFMEADCLAGQSLSGRRRPDAGSVMSRRASREPLPRTRWRFHQSRRSLSLQAVETAATVPEACAGWLQSRQGDRSASLWDFATLAAVAYGLRPVLRDFGHPARRKFDCSTGSFERGSSQGSGYLLGVFVRDSRKLRRRAKQPEPSQIMSACRASGSVTVKTLPDPASLSTAIVPPCASTNSLAMDSPSPAPRPVRDACPR
jgi:hypothetical protein